MSLLVSSPLQIQRSEGGPEQNMEDIKEERLQLTMTQKITRSPLSQMLLAVICLCRIVELQGASSMPGSHGEHMRRIQEFRDSMLRQHRASVLISPSPTYDPTLAKSSSRMYHVISYGADPMGQKDSTEAIAAALSDACNGPGSGFLMNGISNLGGAHVNLAGGIYLVSRPLRFPKAGLGNIVVHGGTLRASSDFPENRYLIELSSPISSVDNGTKATISTGKSYNYEFVTLKDLMLDCNFRGGGISVINSLRIGIHNCYITHFSSEGIQVQSGHETMITDSFIGQHITAGNDPEERNFSGTGITLAGNDNVVSNVVIFSSEIGIMVLGQANLLTGVHCYNKATGLGGTGIYLKLPGKTQTRIVNSYMDYTGIVAEDPVQLVISNNFFLGDAFILLKSINGVVSNVNIVDNIFSGSGKGIDIVQLDQTSGSFVEMDQVLVDRNTAQGMHVKSTIARVTAEGNGNSWIVDLNGMLLFPNLVRHVQYSVSTNADVFPSYVLRNVSGNRVVVESNIAAPSSVYVVAYQGLAS